MAEKVINGGVQLRRATAAEWTNANPVLRSGEMGIETDTNNFKFGNGSSAWNNLDYVINSDNIVDVGAVAGLPAPATGQVHLTVSEEVASRIRDNEDSIIKVRLLLPESTSEGTVIYLRHNTNMWVDGSQPMDFWSCMLDASMYEGHEVAAISYIAALNPSSDAPTLGIQAVEIRNGAKVIDIGQISLSFLENGDAAVNITDEQYDALEDGDRTILKFSTSDGQNIYLSCFCLGSGIIYSAMMAESGIVVAYTASIGGSSQKMVAIRATTVYGSTEGNISTVIDIGTVANFSPAEVGNWTVNISDEMYFKITARAQETTQIKIADVSGNVAYLTRYVDTDGSLIFVSSYTDTSKATLMQLFADVRGSAGNYKIEIACTMHLLGPHPQFVNIGVVQGFEFGVEGSWSVNISDTIYNQIAEGDDVRLVISDANNASVIMPQVAAIQGKKMFGTNSILDQNGARIEYAAGTSGVPGQYRLEIIAVVVEAGGGGVEIVDLGTPTFQEASPGIQAVVTLTSEQAAKLAAEPAPVVKFTLSGAGGGYQNGVYYLDKSFKVGVAVQFYTLPLLLNGGAGWTINVQATSSQAYIAIIPYTLPQEVKANPSDSAGVTLEKLKVGDLTYAIPQGTTVKTAAGWAYGNPVLAAGEIGYDTTNKITKIGDGVTAWDSLNFFVTQVSPTFANSSWAEMAELSESGKAQTFFNVGDEKTIELTTGEEITLVVLGFDHDDLSDGSGKAGMTIGMKNLLATTYQMNATATNAGGWDESEMRTSIMATLFSQLPSDLQSVIKQVDKKAMAGNQSTSITTSADKLWLLALTEITGRTTDGYGGEGERYEYWKTVKVGTVAADRVKYLSNGNGEAWAWWTRSTDVSGSTGFMETAPSGGLVGYVSTSHLGVSFGFCV